MDERNVLVLLKGADRFVFVYDDASVDAVINEFRNMAADPACALNWFDASVLTARARNPSPNAPTGDP